MQALKRLLEQASMRLAVIGDGAGGHAVADRPNYVHARLGDANGIRAEVHTNAIRTNYGDYVYVLLENPAAPNIWRMVFWLRDGSDATLPPPVRGSKHEMCLVVTGDGFVVGADGEFVRAHCG